MTQLVMTAALLTCLSLTVAIVVTRRRARRQAHEDVAQLARFQRDLITCPGVRLTWLTPVVDEVADISGAVELTGTISVETIDEDGHTRDTYSVPRGKARVPVSSGVGAAAAIDGVSLADVYIIDGSVDSVKLTLQSGLTVGTANL